MAHDWPTIRTLRHQLNAVVPLGQAPAGAVQLCVNRSEQTRSWLPCAAPAPLAFASNEAWCQSSRPAGPQRSQIAGSGMAYSNSHKVYYGIFYDEVTLGDPSRKV
jgi:hypothetical protein